MNYNGNCNIKETGWEHWHCVNNKMSLPWAKSMVCMCRLSNRLLNNVKKYVNNNKILVYHEIMFNTLAYKNNYKINTPRQLSRIHYNTTWDINNLDTYYCYHPLKNFQDHNILRQRNMIYFHNLFNDIKYGVAKKFYFDEYYFLRKNLPKDFNFCCYRENNNLKHSSDNHVIWDWFNYGKNENKKYKD